MRCPMGILWVMASEIRESYPLSDLNTGIQAFRDTQGRTHARYPLSVDILTWEYMLYRNSTPYCSRFLTESESSIRSKAFGPAC